FLRLSVRQPIPESGACNAEPDDAHRENENCPSTVSGPESSRIGKHPVNPNGVGDVLDLAIPERLVSANELILDLLVNAARDIHLARIGDAFKTRGDVDPVTVDVVLLNDHIT